MNPFPFICVALVCLALAAVFFLAALRCNRFNNQFIAAFSGVIAMIFIAVGALAVHEAWESYNLRRMKPAPWLAPAGMDRVKHQRSVEI